MRPSPTDLLANFLKIDCYEFYDTYTKNIIEELENKKIKIDHHALILTRIDEILAEDSPRRSKFIKLLIDKQSNVGAVLDN
ncbi:hypothetical protein [uncultured Psychrobacter sp.]|uniref:hypothetical protein n=1 Tax=uncultured Psychrobacter sp. TaxID=259303 RepID=UPI00259880C9|nr:hypothetical protein [uncultured Psychrobacter sp.]